MADKRTEQGGVRRSEYPKTSIRHNPIVSPRQDTSKHPPKPPSEHTSPTISHCKRRQPAHPLTPPPADSGLWFEWEMGFREWYLCKRRLKGNGGGLEMLHILPHTKSLSHKPKIHFSSIVRRNS